MTYPNKEYHYQQTRTSHKDAGLHVSGAVIQFINVNLAGEIDSIRSFSLSEG